MTETDREHEFTRRVRGELDRSLERLEPGVETRLKDIRRRAVNIVKPAVYRRPAFRFSALGSALAAALVVFVVWFHNPATSVVSPMEDVDILAADDGLDLFENLDFYSWLTEQRNHAS